MTGPQTSSADGLEGVAPGEWQSLAGADHPFVSHAYLGALESSGSATASTGWEPAHLLDRNSDRLCGALPLYRKQHSFGEFVFDWAWADACQRAGLPYYPKLLTAVPFTPVTGPRLLGRQNATLIEAGLDEMQRGRHLTWHVLFPHEDEHELWKSHGFLPRMSIRFVWQDSGYGDFEGFLAALKQKRRKEIRRERRQVVEAGVTFRTLRGTDIDQDLLADIYRCYARTYLLRGQHPYLSFEFFTELNRRLPNALVVFLAKRDEQNIAAAICLQDKDTLYGRWWGTLMDLPGLHFEACYYQGIDYCLAHGLTRYDPGIQGEHKVARGFAPESAWSMHRFNHPSLESAVREALRHETPVLESYLQECEQHLPFRQAD